MTNGLRNRLLTGAGVVVAVVGFLLFRPDTLLTDVRVDESLEEAFVAETTEATVAQSATSAASSPTASEAVPTAEPSRLLTGQFVGVNHSAAGTVNIYEQDGKYVLRFEDDTDIQNGPDLYVWVLSSNSYEGGVPTNYLDLSTLVGNVGGQNYDLPDGFDPEVHRTILIWCLRFAVPFATAPLG